MPLEPRRARGPGTTTATAAPHPHPLAAASAAAGAHLALAVAFQVQVVLLHVLPEAGGRAAAALLAELPFLQLENLVVAGALLLVGVAVARGWMRVGYALLAIACDFLLVLDQVAFGVFREHLRYSFLRTLDGLAMVAGSARHELRAPFWIDLGAWIMVATWTWRRVVSGRPRRARAAGRLRPRTAVVALIGVLAYVVASTVVLRRDRALPLERHPLLVLHEDFRQFRDRTRAVSAPETYVPDYERPRARTWRAPDDRVERFAGAAAAARGRGVNIVMVVLESVGARQILDSDGLPDAAVAPRIRRLSERAAVLDAVYTVHAGSVYSWIALLTGGLALDLRPYSGPTLISRLQEHGYCTALVASARLAGQGFLDFVGTVGYDLIWDFGAMPEAFQQRHALHSWGGREEVAVAAALDWIDGLEPGRRFFLQYYTTATHHPYTTPAGWRGGGEARPEPTRRERYRQALRYSDEAVGTLVDGLAARGLLEDTLLVVTGDHGEALGEIHPEEHAHGPRLNDETLRSFAIFSSPTLFDGSVKLGMVAQFRDLMPTLLAFVDPRPPLVPAQSLAGTAFHPRTAFFATELLFGLRDGNWKFISPWDRSRPRLHDLASDPDEQVNLAPAHPELVELYTALARSHFYDLYRTEDALRAAASEPAASEVDRVRFTVPDAPATAEPRFGPVPAVVATAVFDPIARDREFHYGWRAPDGAAGGGRLVLRSGAAEASILLRGTGSLTGGIWTWTVEDASDQVVRVGRFLVVAPPAPPAAVPTPGG